jgi:hypothetical protein
MGERGPSAPDIEKDFNDNERTLPRPAKDSGRD